MTSGRKPAQKVTKPLLISAGKEKIRRVVVSLGRGSVTKTKNNNDNGKAAAEGLSGLGSDCQEEEAEEVPLLASLFLPRPEI
ncbi:hypothetical protein MCOR02_005441 [Pyricularia oryzae]|nr:hypothetical protein MCOR02_005441 [Pyricularia oryzae]